MDASQRRQTRTMIVLAAIVAPALACSAILGVGDHEIEGTPGVDASSPAKEANADAPLIIDAPTLDVATVDAAVDVAVDAGVDANAPVDAGAPIDSGTLCGNDAHALCDDFDHAPFGQNWFGEVGPLNATIGLDSDASVSPPNSLLVACGTGTAAQAELQADFAGGVKVLHCEMDLRIDQIGASAEIDLVQINVTDSSFATYEANLSLGVDPLIQQASAPADGGQSDFPRAYIAEPFVGQWKHIALDLNLVGGVYSIAYDQIQVGTTPIDPSLSNSGVSLAIGAAEAYFPSETVVRFDNVFCDVTR